MKTRTTSSRTAAILRFMRGRVGLMLCAAFVVMQAGCIFPGRLPGLPFPPPGLPRPPGLGMQNPIVDPAGAVVISDPFQNVFRNWPKT